MSDDLIWRPQGKALSVHLSSAALSELSAELPRDWRQHRGAFPSAAVCCWATRDSPVKNGLSGSSNSSQWISSMLAVNPGLCRAVIESGLGSTFARFAKPSESVALVGWYRHIPVRDYTSISTISICSADFFRHQASIGILASPRDRKGGIFFWEDGDIQRTAPYLTFDIPESTAGCGSAASTCELFGTCGAAGFPAGPLRSSRCRNCAWNLLESGAVAQRQR